MSDAYIDWFKYGWGGYKLKFYNCKHNKCSTHVHIDIYMIFFVNCTLVE